MISGATVTVYCDTKGCDYSEPYALTVTARGNWSESGLEAEIKTAGWTIVDENTHFCPQCTEDRQEPTP